MNGSHLRLTNAKANVAKMRSVLAFSRVERSPHRVHRGPRNRAKPSETERVIERQSHARSCVTDARSLARRYIRSCYALRFVSRQRHDPSDARFKSLAISSSLSLSRSLSLRFLGTREKKKKRRKRKINAPRGAFPSSLVRRFRARESTSMTRSASISIS
jgi:hypothetical protein